MLRKRPFLTARWRDLVMLNFRVDPELLLPIVPEGTELDYHAGETYVSIVGFLFLNTRVLGLPIPGHRLFEEVNLRFYVRRMAPDGLRRGVVFVKEIAPRPAVAHVANLVYHENYIVCPMRHEIVKSPAGQATELTHDQNGKHANSNGTARKVVPTNGQGIEQAHTKQAEYAWRRNNRWNRVGGRRAGPFREPTKGSLDEFIVEHYWGYGRDGNGRTLEYRVNHPPWQVAPLEKIVWDCDIAATYGSEWASLLKHPPTSSLLANGSEIAVMRATRLAPRNDISEPNHVEI